MEIFGRPPMVEPGGVPIRTIPNHVPVTIPRDGGGAYTNRVRSGAPEASKSA